jgi:hypothetical protein
MRVIKLGSTFIVKDNSIIDMKDGEYEMNLIPLVYSCAVAVNEKKEIIHICNQESFEKEKGKEKLLLFKTNSITANDILSKWIKDNIDNPVFKDLFELNKFSYLVVNSDVVDVEAIDVSKPVILNFRQKKYGEIDKSSEMAQRITAHLKATMPDISIKIIVTDPTYDLIKLDDQGIEKLGLIRKDKVDEVVNSILENALNEMKEQINNTTEENSENK